MVNKKKKEDEKNSIEEQEEGGQEDSEEREIEEGDEEQEEEKEDEEEQPQDNEQVEYDDDVDEAEADNEYESDDEYDIDQQKELQHLLLKQLVDLYKKNKKREDGCKKKFVPFLKKYLKLNMKQKAKAITDKHVYDFMRLAQAIINKKIKMNLSETDFYQLKELTSVMDPEDRKLVLIEDFRLATLFKRAIRIVESELPRRHERKRTAKVSHDRSR